MTARGRDFDIERSILDGQIRQLHDRKDSFGVFLYLAPTARAAQALHRAVVAVADDVEVLPHEDCEVWLVAVGVRRETILRKDVAQFVRWMKRAGFAHRCHYLHWRVEEPPSG